MKETEKDSGGFSVTDGIDRPNGKGENYQSPPDPEVVPTKRRRLSTAYKIKVIETVGRLREDGESGSIGAYLRKEGLYYSAVTNWERLYDKGLLKTSHSGPKEKSHEELFAEIKRLRRRLDQTEKKLERSELLLEIQKKLSSILEFESIEIIGKNGEK